MTYKILRHLTKPNTYGDFTTIKGREILVESHIPMLFSTSASIEQMKTCSESESCLKLNEFEAVEVELTMPDELIETGYGKIKRMKV